VAPNVIYSMGRGRITEAQAEALRRRGDRTFSQPAPVWAIHDWQDIAGYDAGVRSILTEWALERGKRVEMSIILTGSPLVAMGVAAAGVVLQFAGCALQAHAERGPFERRVLEVCTVTPR
jgi:hypothetical protein